MKRILNYLLVVTGTTALLTGCSTTHHSKQWEYRVTQIPPNYNAHTEAEKKAAFLNDMGKDGWVFIEKDGDGDLYFKRPQR